MVDPTVSDWLGRLASEPFMLAAALGKVPSLTVGTLAGRGPAIPANIPSTVWSDGTLYQFPPAPTHIQVVSDSDEDRPGGTGAHSITLITLRDGFVPSNEAFSLRGTTPVTSFNQHLRIQPGTFVLANAGGVGSNVGTISIRSATDSSLLGVISPQHGMTRQFVLTVPIAHSIIFGNMILGTTKPQASKASGYSGLVSIRARPLGLGTWYQLMEFGINDLQPSQDLWFNPHAVVFQERTDIHCVIERCSYKSSSVTPWGDVSCSVNWYQILNSWLT